MLQLTDEEYNLLEKEFSISPETFDELDEDGLLTLSDRLFDIELEGDISDAKTLPRRCRIASSLMDKINMTLDSMN